MNNEPIYPIAPFPYETKFIVSVPDELWVTDAVTLDGSHVALRFSDGHCGVLDMSSPMDDGVFRRLRNPNVFQNG